MSNTNQTRTIATCRLVYSRVFGLLQNAQEAAEYVRAISQAWKAQDAALLATQLGAVQYALRDVPGAYDVWAACRDTAAALGR